jgi:hypothetical protein
MEISRGRVLRAGERAGRQRGQVLADGGGRVVADDLAGHAHDLVVQVGPLALAGEQEEMALAQPRGRQRQHLHIAQVLARLPQAQRRSERPAQARGDQAEQRVGGVELVAALGLHADVAQVALDLLADHRALAVADQGQRAGRGGERLERGQRRHGVPFGKHGHPGFGEQQALRDARILHAGVGADHHVQLTALHLLGQRGRQARPHLELAGLARHGADQLRAHRGGEGIDAAQADLGQLVPGGGAHVVHRGAGLREQLGRCLVQHAAGRRGPGGAHLAVHQLQAQVFFE